MFGICGNSPSPQPSPREERGEGEVIDRRCRLNLSSSRSREVQLNRTPICAFLRQTTVQGRAADSISRTSVKASGALFRFAPSIAAPVAEIFRTVQVMLSLAKLIL